MSNYQRIKQYDVANGEGIRTSIFFCGCDLHCPECFNFSIWDFGAGQLFTRQTYTKEIRDTMGPYIEGLSILGGEPLDERNIYDVAQLVRWFRNDFRDTKDIWMWSGYEPEEILAALNDENNIAYAQLLEFILDEVDTIVLGRFKKEEKDLSLKWRGSKNQIVFNLKNGKKDLVDYVENKKLD